MTPKTGSNTPDISERVERPGRIIYDGLTLGEGTGVAGYTRMLTRVARTLGYDVGVVYGTAFTADQDQLLQEVLFFDEIRALHQLRTKSIPWKTFDAIIDQIRYNFTVTAAPLRLGGAVIDRQYADLLVEHDRAFVTRNLLENANRFFGRTSQFVKLEFDPPPDIFHCTYPTPLRVRSAGNIYSINDLTPLRLPSEPLQNKRKIFRLLKKIADTADHIVTVSETSKRDIVRFLKVDESRVTNTYQAVAFPSKYLERPERAVANYLDGRYGLEMRDYLLFFGALEPTENVGRLIDAFLSSDVDIPLVFVTGPDWRHADGLKRIAARNPGGSQVRWLTDVGPSALVSLIRGARAVVFPSLYEGFPLAVIEAMMLGTPVVASTSEALAEIGGDAVLLVDPDDVDDIARGLTAIASDADLRRELSRRGTTQAAKFSVARYRERVRSLYDSLT